MGVIGSVSDEAIQGLLLNTSCVAFGNLVSAGGIMMIQTF
jgi:hypothetical protein